MKIVSPTAKRNPCNPAAGISVMYLIILVQYAIRRKIPEIIAIYGKYPAPCKRENARRIPDNAPAGPKILY